MSQEAVPQSSNGALLWKTVDCWRNGLAFQYCKVCCSHKRAQHYLQAKIESLGHRTGVQRSGKIWRGHNNTTTRLAESNHHQGEKPHCYLISGIHPRHRMEEGKQENQSHTSFAISYFIMYVSIALYVIIYVSIVCYSLCIHCM